MSNLKNVFNYTVLTIASIVSVFPFLWMVVSATNKSVEVTKGRLLPGSHFMENFRNLLDSTNLVNALMNSAKIAIVTTLLALLVSSLAGYGFEIFKSKTKDFVFNFLLLSMMIPFAALMVPLFRMFGTISQIFPSIGIDTMTAVILPTVTTAFLIFSSAKTRKCSRRKLLKCGRIDGLSEWGIFFRLYVPTMKTTYAAAAIITFMSSWNGYLWPLVILQSPENQTVPLLISNLGSSHYPDFGMIMTAVVIATLPTALIFFFMQKHFVAGMLGSVK